MLLSLSVLAANDLVSLGAGAAALEPRVTHIKLATNGAALRWASVAGTRYQLQSASVLPGPWTALTNIVAAGDEVAWVDGQALSPLRPRQFYRLLVSPSADASDAVVTGHQLPIQLGALSLSMSDIGARAVFLASQLGAGASRLVTQGALTEEPNNNWRYAATPADQLVVNFRSGTNLTYRIQRMDGDFSQDSTVFLQRPHAFEFQVTAEGGTDMKFTTGIAPGTCSFGATVQGDYLWNRQLYRLNLVFAGEYCFETGFGYYSLLNDYTTKGRVTAPGFDLTLDQRRRFEIIATGKDSASSEEEWNSNTLQAGPDIFRWVQTKKQKSFTDGKPSSLDTYWKAAGDILRNEAPYGSYRLNADSVLRIIQFVLVLPDRVIPLETWPGY